jgi:hypothetical protein
MMKKILFLTLALLFTASLCVNIYQADKLKRYATLRERGIIKYYKDFTPMYPVEGLTIADLSVICTAIDAHVSDFQDRRILDLHMKDRDHVLIQTGIMKDGLWGSGQIFQFKRVKNGWEIEVDKNSNWTS